MKWTIIIGIICLTIIECWALYNGINGTLMLLVVAIIAGAIGVTVPTPNFLKGGG